MEFPEIAEKYKNAVDKELSRFFDAQIGSCKDDFLKESYSQLKEFIMGSGKRLRPICMIMAYKSIKEGNEDKVYPLSIIPELVHCSTLIHDDIMDEDKLRRNRPTMHKMFEQRFKEKSNDKHYYGDLFSSYSKRFSVSMAILQGNILNSLFEECIMQSKLKEGIKNKAIELFNRAYVKTNEGQILDLLTSAKEDIMEKDYLNAASSKTAPLFSASLKFGAMLHNAEDFQLEAFGNYANTVALAFQIQDDVIDISKDMEKGRGVGTDIRKGNKTLIVINALERLGEEDKKAFLGVLGNSWTSEKEIERAIEILKGSGALEYAVNYANELAAKAKGYLKKAKLNEEGNKFFEEFADFAVKRKA